MLHWVQVYNALQYSILGGMKMKKFAKILSVLLCVATLVGMIGMVATAAEKTPTKVVYGGLNEPNVG